MKWGDRVIFACLFFGGILAMCLAPLWTSGGENAQVVIEVDGALYGRYSLQEKNGKTLAIKTKFGYNKVVIEEGQVSVTESDCPDRLEMKAGAISQKGETLVCLPNRLVVYIDGGEDVDALAY
ncbi:MAG: NusG domain II-containing protein [Ruminococcaceae bacterium]|nr:NusG domain II-containing protein [Oscillospiraceae bacterium]